jgi:chromosome segregation ATPase
MDRTNAERQRRWRERRRQDDTAMQDELAALRAHVAELEAELATRPTTRHIADRRVAALQHERDVLSERLAQIEAYQPGITAKARTWVAHIDRASARRR